VELSIAAWITAKIDFLATKFDRKSVKLTKDLRRIELEKVPLLIRPHGNLLKTFFVALDHARCTALVLVLRAFL
jgi:hypothetical protein